MSSTSVPAKLLRPGAFVIALVSSLWAGVPLAEAALVSGNPHAQSLPGGSTPPLAGIAALPRTSANAYHVSSSAEVNNALAYNAYDKPKILSDDAGGISANMAKNWITRVCNAGEHYEHFDAAIGPNATSGVVIDSLNDFPSPSKQVLRHIRDASCVSTLAPGGTLSRSGREFLWNGAPVSLVGHSWMGALSAKNFNINGYLNVLQAHRVNLTRVWVTEQWTGLLVEKAGAPHQSNAVMPFTGSINFSGGGDTLNAQQVNPAFLQRLRSFVQAASNRGIVVQLTLFDRHGVLNKAGPIDYGRWAGSPYNTANNQNTFFATGPSGKAPTDWVDTTVYGIIQSGWVGPGTPPAPVVLRTIHPSHEALVTAIKSELSGFGNVLYEVMNEPRADEWGESKITAFHDAISYRIHGF